MSETTTKNTATSPLGRKNRFVVFYKETILSIKATDVSYFTVNNGSVQLFTLNGNRYLIKRKLAEIEQVLDPNLFFRISRSTIVSFDGIERVEAVFGQRAIVYLQNSGKEIVSKGRLTDFINWLDQ